MDQQDIDQRKNKQQKIQSVIVLIIMLILVIFTAIVKHICPNPLNDATSAESSDPFTAESSTVIGSSAIASVKDNNKKSGISEKESKEEKIIIEALNNFDLSKGFQCTATFSDGTCTIIFDPSSNLMRCVMQDLSKQVIKQYLFAGSTSDSQSSNQTTSTAENDTSGFYVLDENNAWQKIDENTLENAEMDTDNSSYENLQNIAMFQSIITMVSDAIDFDNAKVEMSENKATATALNDVAIDGVNYQDTAVANFIKDKNGKYKTTSLLIKLYCKATKTDYVKLEIKDISQNLDLYDPNFTLTN